MERKFKNIYEILNDGYKLGSWSSGINSINRKVHVVITNEKKEILAAGEGRFALEAFVYAERDCKKYMEQRKLYDDRVLNKHNPPLEDEILKEYGHAGFFSELDEFSSKKGRLYVVYDAFSHLYLALLDGRTLSGEGYVQAGGYNDFIEAIIIAFKSPIIELKKQKNA